MLADPAIQTNPCADPALFANSRFAGFNQPTDAQNLRYRAEMIINDLAESIGADNAVTVLDTVLTIAHGRVALPVDMIADMTSLRGLCADVHAKSLSPQNAIACARRILDGTAIADDPA